MRSPHSKVWVNCLFSQLKLKVESNRWEQNKLLDLLMPEHPHPNETDSCVIIRCLTSNQSTTALQQSGCDYKWTGPYSLASGYSIRFKLSRFLPNSYKRITVFSNELYYWYKHPTINECLAEHHPTATADDSHTYAVVHGEWSKLGITLTSLTESRPY